MPRKSELYAAIDAAKMQRKQAKKLAPALDLDPVAEFIAKGRLPDRATREDIISAINLLAVRFARLSRSAPEPVLVRTTADELLEQYGRPALPTDD